MWLAIALLSYWSICAGILIHQNRDKMFTGWRINAVIALVGGFYMVVFALASMLQIIDKRIHKGKVLLIESDYIDTSTQILIGLVLGVALINLEVAGIEENKAQQGKELAYQKCGVLNHE